MSTTLHSPEADPVAEADLATHEAKTVSQAHGTVKPADVDVALKPSGSATAGTEALRALGTSAGKALPGDDASVTNARVPTAHKASHATGGTDALSPADIGAATAASVTAEATARANADALLIPLAQKGAASGVMVPEGRTVPFVVYVDSATGSDSNLGNSPGSAFATLAKAINTVQVAGKRGHIKVVRMDTNHNINAPIAFVQGVLIECAAPSSITITRNFDTPNGRSVWDAVTTAAGTSVQSATAAFVAGDVNRIACIYGAGTGGGTYYGFISAVPDGTHATIPATAIARNATTDPLGVKLSVVGDWNRVVTDAAITAGGSAGAGVLTSASAAFTTDDVGTEIVVAGAGQNGQALRAAIKSVTNATTAVITANATNPVSGARCAIGVNFGDMFTYHVSTGGLRNFELRDDSNVTTRIGAAYKICCDDWGSGVQSVLADHVFDDLRFTGTGASWEHMIDYDGSWNQAPGGPGVRRVQSKGLKVFGSRRPAETIRIASGVHCNFLGQGIVGTSPALAAQGIMILDPQKTAGVQVSSSDVNFTNFEGVGTSYYCEGQYCTFMGGRLHNDTVIPGGAHRTIHLSPVSDHCVVVTANASVLTGTAAEEYDQGTNNVIVTNLLAPRHAKAFEASRPTALAFETFPRRGASNGSISVGSSGVMVLMAVWLPGGYLVTKVGLQGGGTALAWGTGWSGQHFFKALFDPDGNLLGTTADGGGTIAFSNNFVPLSLVKDAAGNTISSVTAPRSGLHYIGILINSGTGGSAFTYPTFGGITNALAAIAPVLCATSGSGLTAVPTSITAPPVSGTQGLEIYGGAI